MHPESWGWRVSRDGRIDGRSLNGKDDSNVSVDGDNSSVFRDGNISSVIWDRDASSSVCGNRDASSVCGDGSDHWLDVPIWSRPRTNSLGLRDFDVFNAWEGPGSFGEHITELGYAVVEHRNQCVLQF